MPRQSAPYISMFAHQVLRAVVAGAVALTSLAPSLLAADVVVTASGTNTFNISEFFTVSAIDMPQGVFLEQVRIDLQGGTEPDDFWDANQFGGNSPWGFKSGSGITAGDLIFNPANGSPVQTGLLQIDIAPGAMATGDWFTFDYDTDFTISDGDEFAEFGVTVDFVFSNTVTVSTVFADDGIVNFTSTATVPRASISEPGMLGLLSLCGGLAMCVAFRRRLRRSRRPLCQT